LQDCYADHALVAEIELNLGRTLGLLQDFRRAMEKAIMAMPGADIELHRIGELLRTPPIDDDCTFAGSDAHDLRSSTLPLLATGNERVGFHGRLNPWLFESESGRGTESSRGRKRIGYKIRRINNHCL
jgi:hypothetical protein